MNFNPKKCYILSIQQSTSHIYSLCKTPLQYVRSNPYLGIQFSDDLKWSTHIAHTCKKANSTLGFLRRNLRFCPLQCKKNAYLSLVRPVLEYGSIVWSPYLRQDVDKLEKVQRLSARFITGDYKTRTPGSITSMLQSLQLQTLEQRRRDQRLIFLYKVVEGLVPAIPSAEYLTPHKQGRLIKPRTLDTFQTASAIQDHIKNNSRTFHVTRCKTEQFRQSFFISAVRDWNHLNDSTVTAPSVDSFRSRIQPQ